MQIIIKPVISELIKDLEELFGVKGACAGCWCMYWRLPKKQFDSGKGESNLNRLRALIQESAIPIGLLAYVDDRPVGWCAVGPRASFDTILRSRSLVPSEENIWSIPCIFVLRSERRNGIATSLVEHAGRFARSHGASALEAYPVVPSSPKVPDAFIWTGVVSIYAGLGFKEIASPSAGKRIMRLPL